MLSMHWRIGGDAQAGASAERRTVSTERPHSTGVESISTIRSWWPGESWRTSRSALIFQHGLRDELRVGHATPGVRLLSGRRSSAAAKTAVSNRSRSASIVAPWVDGAIQAPPTSTCSLSPPLPRPPAWNQLSSRGGCGRQVACQASFRTHPHPRGTLLVEPAHERQGGEDRQVADAPRRLVAVRAGEDAGEQRDRRAA